MSPRTVMESSGLGRNGPNWKWVLGVAMTIIGLLVGIIMSAARSEIASQRMELQSLSRDSVRQSEHDGLDARLRVVEAGMEANAEAHRDISARLTEIRDLVKESRKP